MTKQADRELDWSTGRELERKDAEIERLRAALQTIVERQKNDPHVPGHELVEIAGRALEQRGSNG